MRHSFATYHLAFHRDQNEFTAAQEALEEAVRYDPAFEPARKALEQVAELAGSPR